MGPDDGRVRQNPNFLKIRGFSRVGALRSWARRSQIFDPPTRVLEWISFMVFEEWHESQSVCMFVRSGARSGAIQTAMM
jgi:hypothetical protein